MEKKITPALVWREYESGRDYNESIQLEENVRKNEDFYIGEQWRDINAPDLEKPALNFLRRVVSYFVSMIVTDDVAVQFTPGLESEEAESCCHILQAQVNRIFEAAKVKPLFREMLRSCVVDGDGAFYFWFDPEKGVYGDPVCELVDNTKVLFGNPFEKDVQKQTHLLVVQRRKLEEVREEARELGLDEATVAGIQADSDTEYYGEEKKPDEGLVTVLTRFWKARNEYGVGTVHFLRCTETVTLREDTDTGYRLYPIAWMQWETVKNSYHGRSPITGLIPNQIFVNKLWAMAMEYCKKMAFPKIIYDMTKVKAWSNKVGEAIGVVGGVGDAVANTFRAGDMSQSVLELVERTINYTRDFMGASDAALGNVRPENTSAIIAVQKAASAPLELQRMGFYQFVEDCVRILLEMIRVNFGIRVVTMDTYDERGNEIRENVEFDFAAQDYDRMELAVDVGASSYWSELMQMQTADNLLMNGVLTDAVTYLETIPAHYLRNKNKIIAKLKEQQALQGQMVEQIQSGRGGQMSTGGKADKQQDPTAYVRDTSMKLGAMV